MDSVTKMVNVVKNNQRAGKMSYDGLVELMLEFSKVPGHSRREIYAQFERQLKAQGFVDAV